MSVRLRAMAALAAGLGSVLAFAPVSLFPLPWLTLAVLFVLLHDAPPRTGAGLAYLFGVGYFGAGVSWVQVSAHQFGVPLYTFSVSVTVLFVLYLALFPALAAGAALSLAGPYRRPARFVALAGAWVIAEWLRGTVFSGFPWLGVGYSQIDGPLRGYLPVAGSLGASAAVAGVAAALAAAWTAVSHRGRAAGGAAALLVVAVGAGLRGLEFSTPAGPPLEVAIVQGNVPQARKWLATERPRTIRKYWALSENVLDADLVIWPETAIPAFTDEVPDVLARIHATAAESGATFFIGIPRRVPADPDDPEAGLDYFNSVIQLGPETRVYDKRHLVPFGEYLPLKGVLDAPLRALGVRIADFSAGPREQPALTVAGREVGVSICYEDVFAREVRRALPGAELLVNVSNDAWFGDSLAPHQHMEIARVRAVESGRAMIRATNTGISAVADHLGRITARSPQFETAVLRAEVAPRTGLTPYHRFGDWPVLAAAVLCLAVSRVLSNTES